MSIRKVSSNDVQIALPLSGAHQIESGDAQDTVREFFWARQQTAFQPIKHSPNNEIGKADSDSSGIAKSESRP